MKKGEAGYEQSQDCQVTVKLKKRGNLNIVLNSKMKKMFRLPLFLSFTVT